MPFDGKLYGIERPVRPELANETFVVTRYAKDMRRFKDHIRDTDVGYELIELKGAGETFYVQTDYSVGSTPVTDGSWTSGDTATIRNPKWQKWTKPKEERLRRIYGREHSFRIGDIMREVLTGPLEGYFLVVSRCGKR
jgi:hypothetical protein